MRISRKWLVESHKSSSLGRGGLFCFLPLGVGGGFSPFRGWGCGFLFPLLLLSLSSSAQKVSAIVSRDKIRMGEQFELKLKVEPTSNAPLTIDNWFAIPDTFQHFQVAIRQPIDTSTISATKTYSQVVAITSFDTGKFKLPSFNVIIGGKSFQTREIAITVLPVDVRMRKDYNDLKDIIEPEPDQDYTIWIAMAVVVLLVTFLFFIIRWLIGRRKLNAYVPSQPLTIEEALKKLDALVPVYQDKEYQLFFIHLIAICKGFSDNQLHITTYSKTTAEYIYVIKQKIPDETLLQQYIQLLHWADSVKFAKSIPAPEECQQSLADAKALLTNLHSSQNKTTTNGI
jgi:hypothetical protein